MIEAYALSGIIIRASKIKKDLRLLGYEYYSNLQYGVNTAATGDCLDR
jgi:NADH:ubiquinone oxidoreductase subunit D